MKISNKTLKEIESVGIRIAIITFMIVLINIFYLVLNFKDISKGVKLSILVAVIGLFMKFSLELLNERRKKY